MGSAQTEQPTRDPPTRVIHLYFQCIQEPMTLGSCKVGSSPGLSSRTIQTPFDPAQNLHHNFPYFQIRCIQNHRVTSRF